MAAQDKELEQLKALKAESAELRAARRKPAAPPVPEPPTPVQTDLPDWLERIEHLAKQMENTARDNPKAAVWGALAVGIVVGQLLARK